MTPSPLLVRKGGLVRTGNIAIAMAMAKVKAKAMDGQITEKEKRRKERRWRWRWMALHPPFLGSLSAYLPAYLPVLKSKP